jgi:hypothetical protein
MGELKPDQSQGNVNVTLGPVEDALGEFANTEFPCPLCGAGLPIRASKRKKPYCTCNLCGVQLFVRGKDGIERLKEMAGAGILVCSKEESASHGLRLYNRLQQLKIQRKELAWKQGIIFEDKALSDAIQILDAEIEKIEGELARIAAKNKGKNEK